MNVYLVDGTYELFRSYFGAPSRKSNDGREVGAVFGMIQSMARLIREHEVRFMACAFDTRIESFRNDLFDGYKTGEGMDPDLWEQFPLIEEAMRAMGVRVWSMIDFEADDALATAAYRLNQNSEVDRIFICSPDKDLGQCLTQDHKVVMLDRKNDKMITYEDIITKFGVPPESIPDYLALVGDAADGIPGIKRWGAKASSSLLSHYQRIDCIPEDPSSWEVRVRGAEGLSEQLNHNRDAAALYKVLATLRTDVPIDTALPSLAVGQRDLDAWRRLGIGGDELFEGLRFEASLK